MSELVQYKPSANAQAIGIPGVWALSNVFIPTSQDAVRQDPRLWSIIVHVAQQFPGSLQSGTRWAVISYKTGITGKGRPEESHASGMAVDLAPMISQYNINDGPMRSLRLSERTYMLQRLAASAKPDHPAIFAEGDHLHIEKSMQLGCVVSYHTYRKAYMNDAHVKGQTDIENKAFRVHPDGSTSRFNPVRSRDASGKLVDTLTLPRRCTASDQGPGGGFEALRGKMGI